MRTPVLFATIVLFAFSAMADPAADADNKKFDPSKLIGSAASTGAEFAAKRAAAFFYDTDCKGKNLDSNASLNFICGALGSFSGRKEEEWKANVTEQLSKISGQLDTLENGQNEIQRQLSTQHKLMEAKFNQVSSSVVATTHLVSIEGLWGKYKAQFDKVDSDLEPASMLSFANEIMKKNPQTILDELNAVLTKPFLDGQSLVRYPFYEYRLTNSGRPVDQIDVTEVYDFAEKKFADFRAREQKAYLMYLWAAKVLESQCAVNPQQCTMPPRSTKDLKADYERYSRQQVEEFNSSLDWFVLSYSLARTTSEGQFLPQKMTDLFLRANYLSSSILSEGGLWGRAFSMGNAWDGSLEVSCGGAAQTLKPILKYSVPVAGNGQLHSAEIRGAKNDPFDWWVSSKRDGVYDEVHFSDSWQIYHYNLAGAAAGPCTIAQNQPGTYLPWVEPGVGVATMTTLDKRSFPFGSFIVIQRAGGTYALMSGGKWEGSTSPYNEESGSGSRKQVVNEWFIEPDHPAGPWVGFYRKGRAEFTVSQLSSRIHNVDLIKIHQTKLIRFPEDRTLSITFNPGNCKKICDTISSSSILTYDIENNDAEKKKGSLEAHVEVGFREGRQQDAVTPTIYQKGRGILLDGSYEKAGDRKKLDIKGPQSGVVNAEPGKGYQLTYAIRFELHTEGRGTDASEYMYRALVAPGSVYLTK